MSLTEKEVLHVAKLAAIELQPGEVEQTKKELSDILDYIAQLSKVSSRGVKPTSHAHGIVNFFRDDIIKDSFSVDELEKNAPDFRDGYFRVPKIIA